MGIFNKDSFKNNKPQESKLTQSPKSNTNTIASTSTSTNTNGQDANWFMYHGGYNHGGYIGSGSSLNSTTVNDKDFGLLKSLDLEGSILSVPAIVDGFIYVGVANSHNKAVEGHSGGGTIYKIDITTGEKTAQYSWALTAGEGDAHGFYGMGCTPTIINEKVYFSAFNGRVYCLNQNDLSHVWDTDLRNADVPKNQPVTNVDSKILANIFASPVLLEEYILYVIGLMLKGLTEIDLSKEKDPNAPDSVIAKALIDLGKKLVEAEETGNEDKIKAYTANIAQTIKEGIKSGLGKLIEEFLQWVLSQLGLPVAAGWCSPTVVNFGRDGKKSTKLYVGVAEGENPLLYGFIYALDAESGKVDWIYCTNKNDSATNNTPNQLPLAAVNGTTVTGYEYTTTDRIPKSMGCSVWAAIAYDEETGLIYASTGNPQPDGPLRDEAVDYSNGILALEAETGKFKAFQQMPATTSYRVSDIDVDIGSSCTIFDLDGQKVVGVGCKNGGFMICDAYTLDIIGSTCLLPKMNDGSHIAEIDVHPPKNQLNVLAPHVSNKESNENKNENYFGPFNTAAVHPPSKTLFVGIGGPNYHLPAPGIDYNTTPFMKAINMEWFKNKDGKESVKLDAWPMDGSDPPRYVNTGASMYKTPGESGLSSPAVVNDVVFCSTCKVGIYAFDVANGNLLWSRNIGEQTGGLNGGYGYCMGPAIWKDYVVAGGLILGQSGGILEIYGPINKPSA
ncbi:MAG: outer membrane protein assembly factor BamB [Saprospiraceae bacterium]|jgi:outer membrane protein assembly factor BamB